MVPLPHVNYVRIAFAIRAGYVWEQVFQAPAGTAFLLKTLVWSGTREWGVVSIAEESSLRASVEGVPFTRETQDAWDSYYETLLPQEVEATFRLAGARTVFSSVDPEWLVFGAEFPPELAGIGFQLLRKLYEEGIPRRLPEALHDLYSSLKILAQEEVPYLYNRFFEQYFAGHPYRYSLWEARKMLDSLTLQAVEAFVRKTFTPGRTVVLLIGNLKIAFQKDPELRNEIRQIQSPYADIPASQVPGIPEFTPAWKKGEIWIEEWARFSMGLRGVHIPIYSTSVVSDLSMEVLLYALNNDWLTGFLDSFMLAGMVRSAQAGYVRMPMARVFTLFVVPENPQGKKPLRETDHQILQALEQFEERLRNSPSYAEKWWEEARRTWFHDLVLSLQDPEGIQSLCLDLIALNISPEEYRKGIQEILNAPPEMLAQTLKGILEAPSVALHVSGDGTFDPPEILPAPPPEISFYLPEDAFSPFVEDFLLQDGEGDGWFQNVFPFAETGDILLHFVDTGLHVMGWRVEVPEIRSYLPGGFVELRYPYGALRNPWMPVLVNAWQHATVDTFSPRDFTRLLARKGCHIQVDVDDLAFRLRVDWFTAGKPASAEQIFSCLQEASRFFFNPVIGPDVFAYLQEEILKEREREVQQMDVVADAVLQYVMYGENSAYTYRPGKEQLEEFFQMGLLEVYRDSLVMWRPQILTCCGEISAGELYEMIRELFWPGWVSVVRPPDWEMMPRLVPQPEPRVYTYPAPASDTAMVLWYFQPESYDPQKDLLYQIREMYLNLVLERFSAFQGQCYSPLPPFPRKPVALICEVKTHPEKIFQAYREITHVLAEALREVDPVLLRWATMEVLAFSQYDEGVESVFQIPEVLWYAHLLGISPDSLFAGNAEENVSVLEKKVQEWMRRDSLPPYQVILIAPESVLERAEELAGNERKVFPLRREMVFRP